MNIILSLRGTSGSGKTTVARTFLTDYPCKPLLVQGMKKHWGYEIDLSAESISAPLFVIGSYENTCGGTDGINTQEEIAERALAAFTRGHVLLEGLLLSKVGPRLSPLKCSNLLTLTWLGILILLWKSAYVVLKSAEPIGEMKDLLILRIQSALSNQH